jgi:hypothetical protein
MPKLHKRNHPAGAISVLAVLAGVSAPPAAGQTSITTYHYDNNRTGWNQTETVLKPSNVGAATFGLRTIVPLDDQVDAQPLVVPGVPITAGKYPGTHDVVYVATGNNSVYAIDVHSGAVLLHASFGAPVSFPLGCTNNGPNVGITSTPVIDLSSNTLYAMVYTQASTGPAYYLHALDLGSLTDKVTPQLVTASHTLTDGSTFTFNATYQRQRPGLLLANGVIYAGFGSFCDFSANVSRGWLLGWSAGTLTPLAGNQLLDQLATSADNFFLSSIWMSGYGPATDDSGNILVVTGNSDPSGTSYNGVTNIQESVVKIAPTLTAVLDLFTPRDQARLDEQDTDFGSGGVLVLPDQPGSTPRLAVAAGKDGNMYLMDEDDLGGYSTTTDNVLGAYPIGGCWCGQSYFVDPSDGAGRVVSSGGQNAIVWKVLTSPSVSLQKVAESVGIGGSQGPGFFTSISSNGTSNPIIWALSRPQNISKSPIYLFAFNPDAGASPLQPLFEAVAGLWPNLGGNSNLVPVVANGHVFVASNKELRIFGLLPNSPNFQLTATPASLAAEPGGMGTFQISVRAEPGFSFNGTVTLSTSGLPAGITGTFNPPSISGANSATLTVSVGGTVALGSYPFTITGVSGTVTQSASVTLVVTNGSAIVFPGGPLTVPGTSSAGVRFTYNGTLTQLDTIAFSETGEACLQATTAYCTNGAGIVVVAGSTPVGGTSSFSEAFGTTSGLWNYGALLMVISGVSPVGTVQIFPANAQNGLGSQTPPVGLSLPSTSLASLGFSPFSVTNPTIAFLVADTNYADNSGSFVLAQSGAK